MNRPDAKKIAQTITNEQLKQMFDTAKELTKDWTKVSSCNKGFTKGTAWNILARDFDVNQTYTNIAKVNMIREFGEFLPHEVKPKKPSRPEVIPFHQDPIFN